MNDVYKRIVSITLPEKKRKIMKKAEGVWRHTALDRDSVWKKVFERKSRKQPIKI